MIISIAVEKAFDKRQYPFIKWIHDFKTSISYDKKLNISIFYLMQRVSIKIKSIAKIILSERLNVFLLTRMTSLTTLFNIILKVLISTV